MKKKLLFIALAISLTTQAQTDTASNPITVLLPVKAIVLYGAYLSQSTPTWADRKVPDQLLALIGSGTQSDSIVTVTIPSGRLANFAINLYADRFGAFATINRSIFSNLPAITGYTALFTQIAAKAAGNSSQKDAAAFVQNKFGVYSQNLTDLYNQMYAAGLAWIRN